MVTWISFCVAACVPSCALEVGGNNGQKDSQTDSLEYVSDSMARAGIPGLSIAVIRDSAINLVRHFGVANAETGAPVTDETLFEAASLSKPLCAYVVLKLHDRKVIDLDTPLVEYVDEATWENEKPMNKKNLAIWGLGFIFLCVINILVELVLLPLTGLDNSSKNDIYFQSWWVVVGGWFVFGNMILKALTGTATPSA